MKLILITLFIFSIPLSLNAQGEDDLGGRTAPNFILEDLDGEYVELTQEIGEGPILLSFWATWCKPCLEEMAELKEIYKDYRERGFKILAISTDNERTVAKVKPLVNSKGYDFPILYDTNSEVSRTYYARAVPYTVLIDKKGAIVYTHMGYMKGDENVVRKKVKELIGD